MLFTCLFLSGCAAEKGNPVAVAGAETAGKQLAGTASYYSQALHGQRTASGETYDMNKLTAAHRSLAFGTLVEITNQDNGRRTTVKINDRGPTSTARIIDVSQRAALELGMVDAGLAEVTLQVVSVP